MRAPLVSMLLLAWAISPAQEPPGLAITNVTVIDGTDAPSRVATVVVTVAASWLVAGEHDGGRLVAGHRADLLVVPAVGFSDPLDASALAATRPLATLIDGELVHRAPAFDR